MLARLRAPTCLTLVVTAACSSWGGDTSWYVTDCAADVEAGQAFGVLPIPESLEEFGALYCKYTYVGAPNGKEIRIFAQNEISNEQLLYARGILEFYLEDYPGSEYGADKSAIANRIADHGAILSMLNGRDGQYAVPYERGLVGQPLYDEETPAIGTPAYLENDYDRRDAAFEEILHFVHDAGIGVDFPGAPEGVAPEFQARIRAATTNALPENEGLWASSARAADWLEELRAEGSLTQEYLAAVIDSYYGLWGGFMERPGGMWGEYVARTRQEIAELDPMGYELAGLFFNPYLTFEARVDPGFQGTFRTHYDPEHPYTHKSRYLVRVTLLGDADSGIDANDRDNCLMGNHGDNVINGRGGVDVVSYSGRRDDYTLEWDAGRLRVVDRRGTDGSDQLIGIEFVAFTDQTVDVTELTASAPEASGHEQERDEL